MHERNGWPVGDALGKSPSLPSPEEVRAQLAHVLRSPEFMVPERARSFLRYLVEQTLAGRADRLKGYTIATAVFERDGSFDPQADPVVRTEAGRLRRALERYYLVAGQHDPVLIEVPKGRYVPSFSRRSLPTPEPAAAESTADRSRANKRICRTGPLALSAGNPGGSDGAGGGSRRAANLPRPTIRGHRRRRVSGPAHAAGDALRQPRRGQRGDPLRRRRDGRDPDQACPLHRPAGAGRKVGAGRPGGGRSARERTRVGRALRGHRQPTAVGVRYPGDHTSHEHRHRQRPVGADLSGKPGCQGTVRDSGGHRAAGVYHRGPALWARLPVGTAAHRRPAAG